MTTKAFGGRRKKKVPVLAVPTATENPPIRPHTHDEGRIWGERHNGGDCLGCADQRARSRALRYRRMSTARYLESIGIHELTGPPSSEQLRSLVLTVPAEERVVILLALDVCRHCGRDRRTPHTAVRRSCCGV